MIGVIYLGGDSKTQERLRYLPGQTVLMAANYKEAAKLCSQRIAGSTHYVVLYQQTMLNEDIAAITYIRKKCGASAYIVLLTAGEMQSDVRRKYLSCGINDTLSGDVSVTAIAKKVTFIADRESILFDAKAPRYSILQFKIPLWKRLFDIVFSALAIVLLSPVFIITAIAIKLESKGPVVFRSKRVGTNYTIFDFLKFRSMYSDAEQKLKALSREHNQYAETAEAEAKSGPTTHKEMTEDDLAGMMIGDDEVMLIGDDFVVGEEEVRQQKEQDNNNAFVKIENDPRITRVGAFIRKYSIDELPQLFNILRGDMSIVGNRPLPLYEAEKLTSDECIDRFMAPAGLTGLWQVEERGKGGMMSAEERKQLDIRYGQTYSFALDMKIIFRTIFAFVQKEKV